MATEHRRTLPPSPPRGFGGASAPSHSRTFLFLVVVLFALVAVVVVLMRRGPAFPAPGSQAYEDVSRAFYWGLSALEVGLLDDARQQFSKAAELVPEEPASWADLGLTQLRLGELEAAAAPIERALALAPGNGDIVLLAAKMEAARGRLDEAVARLRQAVTLDAGGLRSRFALAEELQRLNTAEADVEALALLDAVLERAPNNLAALVDRARIAARRGDEPRLRGSRDALAQLTSSWSPQAIEQFTALERAIEARRFEEAARATTFLRNVLTPVPAFRESLAAVRTPAELIAEPFDRFLVLTPPEAEPAPPDPSITFSAEAAGGDAASGLSSLIAMTPTIEDPPLLFAADAGSLRRLDGSPASWPVVSSRGGSSDIGRGGSLDPPSLLALDWNHDFRTDIVAAGPSGVRVFLQDEQSGFADATAKVAGSAPVADAVFGAWPADIEMDGDIDIVVGSREGQTFVMRNNGDTTWRRVQPFGGLGAVRGFGWADLDRDADADALFLGADNALHLFANRQAGVFSRMENVSGVAGVVAVAVADIDADGGVDVVALESSGVIRKISRQGAGWINTEIASWQGLDSAGPGTHRLLVADLDNNGALDVIAAGGGASRIWLAGADHTLQLLPAPPAAEVFAGIDRNGDGRIDLAALMDGRPSWLMNGGGKAGYHWKVIRPRGQQRAGDQRINSFGVGGSISVRSGLLVQTQIMTGTPVHFGLGTHTTVDVARIVWPSGIAQAEFGTGADEVMAAEQRLKGSCPWVFAWDGSRMTFVTDFLWRSPLGLRINAQDTAGVGQTEDWIRIAGSQLAPRDGFYDVRITAELWETHFFDHVSLMVVDHPKDTEVFVDERFRPAQPPTLEVRSMRMLGPVAKARDELGRDVTDVVAARDGRYLASFERGPYQGIAQEHYVELDVAGRIPPRGATLVASGWIYPTDSSINVAIGQGGHVKASGVALEALGEGRTWVVLSPDIGYPAGKDKTMLIDLTGARKATRLRLRTNLEVYWDSFALAEDVGTPMRTARLPVEESELRYRGFSETTSPRGDAPETPDYSRIATVSQRWRDLVGFHTRFGNVNPLLSGVDDRYVIMNAGDEMRLRFREQPTPASGWRRDFVLIGDGWEKDGDFNTGFSQTVLPLPSHDRRAYGDENAPGELERDPVYQRHRSDWEEYHTRFVSPDAFIRGLTRQRN